MTALAETVVGGGGVGSPESPQRPPRESRGSWEHSDKGTRLKVRLIHKSLKTEVPLLLHRAQPFPQKDYRPAAHGLGGDSYLVHTA